MIVLFFIFYCKCILSQLILSYRATLFAVLQRFIRQSIRLLKSNSKVSTSKNIQNTKYLIQCFSLLHLLLVLVEQFSRPQFSRVVTFPIQISFKIQLLIIIKIRKMVKVLCGANFSCPYQYYCDTVNNQCLHNPLFPLEGYPIAIYCLIPFAAALCNTTGNSFGEFKVPLLMIALNYSEADATILSYPLVAGTALYNFFLLMFRRHPTKNTSLVDYNIVIVIIPSVLFGSTIGTILNDILPPVVANTLIIILLTLFSVKFFCKLKTLLQEEAQKEKNEAESMQEMRAIEGDKGKEKIEEPPVIEINLITRTQEDASQTMAKIGSEQINALMREDKVKESQILKENSEVKKQKSNLKVNSNQSEDKKEKKSDDNIQEGDETINPFEQELKQKLEYEESMHLRHIAGVLVIFVIFAALSLLAQGKLVKFSNCTKWYPIGMCILAIIYAASIIITKKFINNRIETYKRIGYEYEYPLEQWKYYGVLLLGALFGGFNSGLFSKGNSTTIIFTLLYLGVQPIVASAIVGFQVVFSAAVSLIQAYSKGQLLPIDIAFYLGVTFILGGICSHIASNIVKRMDKNKVNKILLCIIGCLTGLSALSLIISMGVSFEMFGTEYMVTPDNFCN